LRMCRKSVAWGGEEAKLLWDWDESVPVPMCLQMRRVKGLGWIEARVSWIEMKILDLDVDKVKKKRKK